MTYLDRNASLVRGYNPYIEADKDDMGTQMDVGLLVMEPGDTYRIQEGEKETAVLLLVRPVSGSGALAVGSQLMEQYGPDSYIGRVTAVMLGCSETTFYTVAVYYGAAGIRRTRHTVPAALAADAAAFIAAAWAVRVFFP